MIGKALTAASVVAAILVVPSQTHATAGPMLPDLRQAPIGCGGGFGGDPSTCTDWDVCLVANENVTRGRCATSGDIKAVRLRFTTSVDNVGDGPLVLYGHRDSRDTPTMSVRQALQSSEDGSIPLSYAEAQRPTGTSAYYEPAKTHVHWHLMNFEHFELRTAGGDTLVTDRKNGFCLGDRYRTADHASLAHTPHDSTSPAGALAKMLSENMCGHHKPSALDVVQGISVGHGDDYKYKVDFQYLDLTHVPSGVYDVVNTVNADRTLLEKDYGNNASALAVSVQWPGGAADPPAKITTAPRVSIVRSCPGAIRCAAPASR